MKLVFTDASYVCVYNTHISTGASSSGRTYGRTVGRTDRQTDTQTDGWTSGPIRSSKEVRPFENWPDRSNERAREFKNRNRSRMDGKTAKLQERKLSPFGDTTFVDYESRLIVKRLIVE